MRYDQMTLTQIQNECMEAAAAMRIALSASIDNDVLTVTDGDTTIEIAQERQSGADPGWAWAGRDIFGWRESGRLEDYPTLGALVQAFEPETEVQS